MLYNLLINSAAKYPDNTAIEDKNGSISYRELLKSSSVLGGILQNRFKDKRLIGVLMEKSINSLIAIFGILSVQSAYVPLDESLPHERLQYIIEDAGLDCLITDKLHYDLALKLCEKENILLFDETKLFPDDNKTFWSEADDLYNRLAENMEESLAYILYTSGSTGFPKGIMHTHKSALAFINWAADYFKVNDGDIFSSHAPFHFDLSIFDIYVCIAVGAKLCILPKSISSFPTSLINYIKLKGITVWYSVPYILVNMFSESNIDKCDFDSLRIIIYAGEAMMPRDAARIQKKLPQADLYNLYGPTETNVITYYKLTHDTYKRNDQQIPIGYPCPYANIQVLDQEGNEVKDGESGELVVKSNSLMMGYVNKDHLKTDNYSTGDIVKKESGGLLVFIGRKDHMVKLNGFRVELGDIEHHVKCFEGIKDCYAKVSKLNSRDIIEVMIEADKVIQIEELKQFMTSRLPGYMLPYNYVICNNLERNSRGKLIRK